MHRTLFPIPIILFLFFWVPVASSAASGAPVRLSELRAGQRIADFEVANLYADAGKQIVGAKFVHSATGAPIYILQIDTTPQVFMWVDTPVDSNRGLPHALEHLLVGKGTTGRYCTLLTGMRLSYSRAATDQDFVFYSFVSGSGMNGFMEQFHCWLRALYHPDFSDLEATHEFYHFGVSFDPAKKERSLVEQGTVYAEETANPRIFDYWYQLNRRVLGDQSPFAFNAGGNPQEMRDVTPEEIRRFHRQHYRLGSTTGFIFAVNASEDLTAFLQHVSTEFAQLPHAASSITRSPLTSKYPLSPAQDLTPAIYPFPSANDTAPGTVEFAWKIYKTDSALQLKLLQLLLAGLGQGQQSLLYASLIDSRTQTFASKASDVSGDLFLRDSPAFPSPRVTLSGIPGTDISKTRIERLRRHILARLQEVNDFPESSEQLRSFNRLILRIATTQQHDDSVRIKNPPSFGISLDTSWKEYLEVLDVDRSFRRNIAESEIWTSIQEKLNSGQNVWRDVIDHFHLLNTPFATASVPSTTLLKDIEQRTRKRIDLKLQALMHEYKTQDEQEALARFAKEETENLQAIERIQATVPRPSFTSNPPLTRYEGIHYRKLEISGVPALAIAFHRPPTSDITLNFDLTRLPRQYYKYLPLFPAFLDSAGLRQGNSVTRYPDLLAQIQKEFYKLSIQYSSNPVSKRAELAFRGAILNDPNRFPDALSLLRKILKTTDLSPENLPRLRDIVNRRVAADDAYLQQYQQVWLEDPALAFRHEDDELYLALNSHFTQTHFDDRLQWLLHQHATPEQIRDLGVFATALLQQCAACSRSQLSKALASSQATGIKAELVTYWQRNLAAFPESQLQAGLQGLTLEAQQDLKTGPEHTLEEIREMQAVILNRKALNIELASDEASGKKLESILPEFLDSIPANPLAPEAAVTRNDSPIWDNLKRRYPSLTPHFPVNVGLVVTNDVPTGTVFTADFPGYTALDQKSLLEVLSSGLFSGNGPQSFYMKTWEAGLAYSNGIASESYRRLLLYYADHVPDITALVSLVNSIPQASDTLSGTQAVDYALSQVFEPPLDMLPFSERARIFALNNRDGNTPDTIRKFSQRMLELRHDPELSQELIRMRVESIDPVLFDTRDRDKKKAARSIFFFLGPEQVLSSAALRLPAHDMLLMWPSDYWMQ